MAAPPSAADAVKSEEQKVAEVKPAEISKEPEETEEFPDPDEDDLDDLDAMLDDFSSVKVEDSKKPAPTVTAKEPPKEAPPTASAAAAAPASAPDPTGDGELSEEDFAKQLEAGMAGLLGELEQNPDMQKQFEDMFKSFGATMGEGGAQSAPAGSKAPTQAPEAGGDATFQETIRKTMERMQASGDQATAAATTSSEEDFMSELLKQMGSGDFNAEGGEEDFSKMLMGMMEQLTNKEILYEPMKELHDKFPEWLEKNKDKTSAEDMTRYQEQKVLVDEIVAKFEESTYSDSNQADREYIVDRMQKMQAAGSPPTDLVGDMSAAQDMFNGPDEQCNPQ